MITAQPTSLQPDDWQKELARAICDPLELIETLRLPRSLLPQARSAIQLFPLRVTRHFVSLMQPGDPDDPLLRQVLPLGAELRRTAGYSSDPVGDLDARLGPGVLQKYAARALLVTTGACALHCRYCFRREYPYSHENALRHAQRMLDTLRRHPDLDEVILSGGDPLSLSDTRLESLFGELEAIAHLKRVRLHTRLPVALPSRITDRLVALLRDSRLHSVLVIHTNHPNEISPPLAAAMRRLRDSGIWVLNQSVLLAGVNDSLATLVRLSEALFEAGVMPYYLHLLDPVQGAAHFEVPDTHARRLQQGLREALPGYLVPRLVRELAGEPGKTPFT